LLRLQGAIGNAAVTQLMQRAVPVQRFGGQQVTSGTGPGPNFVSQTPHTWLRTRPPAETPAGQLPWALSHDAPSLTPSAEQPVPVRVSAKADLAVHDAPNLEPKEFYSSSSVFEESVAALRATGSFYRLKQRSETIKVADPNGRRRTLNRVVAAPAPSSARRFGQRTEDECIEVAGLLMGIPRRRRRGEIIGDDGRRYSEQRALELGHRMTPAGPGRPASGDGTFDERAAVEAYGAAHRAGTLVGAQELGLNQYANPGVGQSFAITSLGSDGPDFAAPGGARSPDDPPWNFHFGGVVARSGNDRVTMENYTRSAVSAVAELHAVLMQRYRQRTNPLVQQWQRLRHPDRYTAPFAPVGPAMEAVRKLIDKEAAQVGGDGEKEYLRLVDDAIKHERWYFRMYGGGPGQSFHEQVYGGGAANSVINPVTVAVQRPAQDLSGIYGSQVPPAGPQMPYLHPQAPYAAPQMPYPYGGYPGRPFG
jgi:hypothetical protein